jgi:hemoglobin
MVAGGRNSSTARSSSVSDWSGSSSVSELEPTLIDKIGGPEAAMSVLIPAVEIFYTKLLSDERIKHYFEGIDTDRLKTKQVEFLAYVFGGPTRYTGKDIAEAHKQMIEEQGLNETHFDIVAGHFKDTLVEMHCAGEIVDEAMEILATSRPIFERPHKDDPIETALEAIQRLREEQERDIESLSLSLEKVGLRKDRQSELLRSAIRMRGLYKKN